MRAIEHLDAGREMHVLRFPERPHLRLGYDAMIARLDPSSACAYLHDITAEPPRQLAACNARLNGWSESEITPEFWHECLMALRALQSELGHTP